MKLAINLIVLALAAFAGYVLYLSIQEPIAFKTNLNQRTNAVVDQLITIREANKLYWDVAQEYPKTWEQLKDSLLNGKIRVEKIIGDPDDPNFSGEIIREMIEIPVRDTALSLFGNLDSLKYVPFGNGAIFDIKADTLEYKQTMVNVVEVGTPYATFMGKYADNKYSKYDDSYDPNKRLKFGDMTKPSLAGSWDRSN